MKMRNGMEELKEDVRELKRSRDKIPSEVGTSTSMCSSRTQSLEERRANYDGEFKHRRSTNLLQYLEIENLSEEVALQILPDELKSYPFLVRGSFANNRKGFFSHSAFADFQSICTLVDKLRFKKLLLSKGSKSDTSGTSTRKSLLSWIQHFDNAVFYGRFLYHFTSSIF
jgi:hypothetical protein